MIWIHIERAFSIFNPSSEELVEGFYSVKLIVVAIYVVLFCKAFYEERRKWGIHECAAYFRDRPGSKKLEDTSSCGSFI